MESLEIWLGMDWESAGLIILNLVLIESLLSVDNAAVLATMVMDLDRKDRPRALQYGIIGAYAFRGLCLLFAYQLVKIWWLKPLGGLYLLWLAADYFKKHIRYGEQISIVFKVLTIAGFVLLVHADAPVQLGGWSFNLFWLVELMLGTYAAYLLYSLWQMRGDRSDDGELNKSNNAVYRFFYGKIGAFWSTVILVEIMDLAFSIDNVFAAVAFTDNLWLICTGVFIGILAMRFVAQWFVRLMEQHPALESMAFLVIAVLGLKLALSLVSHIHPDSLYARWIETEKADLGISIFTVACFVFPVFMSFIRNISRR